MGFWQWINKIFRPISSKKTNKEIGSHLYADIPCGHQHSKASIIEDIASSLDNEKTSSLKSNRLAALKKEYEQLCIKLQSLEERTNEAKAESVIKLGELPRLSYDNTIRLGIFTPLSLKPIPTMNELKEVRKAEEKFQIKIKEQEVTKHLGLASDYIGIGDYEKAHLALSAAGNLINTIEKPEIEHRYMNLSKLLIRKDEEAKILKRAKISEERKNKKKAKEERKRLLFNIQHKNTHLKSGYKITINDFVNHGISHLYHFTSKANLKSIIEYGGLYARAYHSKVGISVNDKIPDSAVRNVNEVDVPNYICLSICKEHYMAREQFDKGVNVCVLKISIDVVKYYSTYFTDRDISEESIRIGRECYDTTNINFEATKNEHLTSADIDYSQKFATVLVDGFIPLSMIENIDNPIILK